MIGRESLRGRASLGGSGRTLRRVAAALTFALVATVPALVSAQELGAPATSPLVPAIWLALLGLAPFALVITTSFAKFAVVLAILRSALGTQNVPPNVVLASLAVILSMFVMAPIAADTAAVAESLFAESTPGSADVGAWIEAAGALSEPLRAFLVLNSGADELALFASLRGVESIDDLSALPLSVVVPAFTITELKEAFQIGFLLFLPFLVLDLLIGAVLLSLGMHMLSPTSVSMPFKLLLFVLVNGWVILSQNLVLGYAYPGAL